MRRRGRFFSFEGGEGSGKTTVVNYLVKLLSEGGHEVVLMREPGGTAISEKIRTITHDVAFMGMHPRTEALLMMAARAQVVAEGYLPALEAREIVLADRYVDSTYAYQGYGRGMVLKELRSAMHLATGGLMPEKTFLFDVDPGIGHQRRGREGRADRIELESSAFFQRVREGYLRLAEAEPNRFVLIDASRSLKVVADEVRQMILQFIGRT